MTRRAKSEPKICVFCGTNQASTRDHVPPKGIFARPLPTDLVTVPACGPCNNRSSHLEEKFRAMLSLRVGVDTPQSMSLWENKARRGVRRNRRLYKEIMKGMKQVWLKSPGGVIFGKAWTTEWDRKSHDETISRITRGLYFHHYEEILPPAICITPYYLSGLNQEMLAAFDGTQQCSIGGDQFVYLTGRAADEPTVSIWLYQFHQKHWALAWTNEAKLEDERRTCK